MARLGVAWLGEAGQGAVRQGKVGPSLVTGIFVWRKELKCQQQTILLNGWKRKQDNVGDSSYFLCYL